ncbi:MAG TPA: heparan-alpha-glucosaminide N-acetyltransferase domain-containing protein [Nocardioidaceae bacterium]|nr:heparan-alpha-glucosaminide N-acetyltransferase domain-containing protein [Nocardioidaceae bacterium]
MSGGTLTRDVGDTVEPHEPHHDEPVTDVPRHTRVTSLDTVRGVLLVLNILVISTFVPRHEQLVHAEWFGVTVVDTIFPLFVTFSGVGLAFAHRNHVGWRRMFRRSFLLLVIGLAYSAVMTATTDLAELRLTGPLQVYAVLVLVIGALHVVLRSPLAWGIATAFVAAAHTFLLAAWQAGCPGGELAPTCNPSRVVDFAVLGVDHVYAQGLRGHDPEGLVATLGALVTAMVGTTAGHIALSRRGSWRAPAWVLGWAAVVVVMAIAASTYVPAMKRLWTAPFALAVAALAIAVLAVGVALLDLRTVEPWARARGPLTWPLVAIGRNSLLVYFGSHLVLHVLDTNGGEVSWAHALAERVDVIGNAELSYMLFMLLGWVAVTAVLHRFRIYLRP